MTTVTPNPSLPTLYDDPLSRNGYKVRLLLSHLNQPFNYVQLDLLKGETRTPQFLSKNPAGRIPLLELPDGTCLPESNAILCYLAEGTPFLPQDKLAKAQVLRWMFNEQNMIECTIGTARFYVKQGMEAEKKQILENRQDNAMDALRALDLHLEREKTDWVTSSGFTIADIALYGYISVAEGAKIDMNKYPNVEAWRKRVEALPKHLSGN